MLPRILYGMYVLLRMSEASELGHVSYTEAHSLMLATILVFSFLFGLAVVLAGVHSLGAKVAVTWHIVLELLLVPLSLYFAKLSSLIAPAPESVLAPCSASQRFLAMAIIYLVAQFLLAMAGLHIVKWLASDKS